MFDCHEEHPDVMGTLTRRAIALILTTWKDNGSFICLSPPNQNFRKDKVRKDILYNILSQRSFNQFCKFSESKYSRRCMLHGLYHRYSILNSTTGRSWRDQEMRSYSLMVIVLSFTNRKTFKMRGDFSCTLHMYLL